MSQNTKLQMQSLISESAAATTSTKKRASGSGLVTRGLVSAAAAEALSKRARPSTSTGVWSRRAWSATPVRLSRGVRGVAALAAAAGLTAAIFEVAACGTDEFW